MGWVIGNTASWPLFALKRGPDGVQVMRVVAMMITVVLPVGGAARVQLLVTPRVSRLVASARF